MADFNIEFIDEAITKLNTLKNLATSGVTLDKLKDQVNGVNDSIGRLKNNVPGFNTVLKNSEEILLNIVSMDFEETFTEAANGISKWSEQIRKGNSELTTFLGKALLLTPHALNAFTLGKGFDSITKGVEGSSASLGDMHNNLKNVFTSISPNMVNKQLEGIFGWLGKIASSGDSAKNMETSLLRSAAASGDLGRMLQTLGDDFSGLTAKSLQFVEKTADVGTATGLTAGEVAGYAQKLMSIPGSMDQLIETTDGSGKSISMLEATVKTAQGTFQEVGSVIENLNVMFLEMGTTGTKALETISQMRSASDALRIPLNLVNTLSMDAGKQFKFLGDNSQGAISILGHLGPALRESGLGPKAIQELTSGVIESIGKMGTAQKAFLAGQTAGQANGLQGAFQVDLMLKQGKIQDVQKMMEDSLKRQFGGRIVTLEQAASNQASASQFQKQLAFMTGGPTPMARDDQQAMALIEAMSKGETMKPDQMIKSSKDAFSDAMANSEKIQARQLSAAVVANNWQEKIAGLQAVVAYNTTRELTGSDSMLAKALGLNDIQNESSSSAAGSKLITGMGIEGGKEINETVNETLADGLDAASTMVSGMGSGFNEIRKKMAESLGVKMPEQEEPIESPEKTVTAQIGRTTIPEPPRRDVMRTLVQEETLEKTKTITTARENQKIDITLKPVCGNCLKDMPDQNTVLQMIDGKIEILEGGRATGVASGVYKQK